MHSQVLEGDPETKTFLEEWRSEGRKYFPKGTKFCERDEICSLMLYIVESYQLI